MSGVGRRRCIIQMHLPHRRHGRERNRDAKRENEREKSQTWSHRKTSFWNQNQRDRLMILDWSLAVRERPHTQIHENGVLTQPRLEGHAPLRARLHRPASPARAPMPPGIRHAQITFVGGLPFRTLGELKAIVGVVPEDVRLFHTQDVGTELVAPQSPLPDRNYRELRTPSVIGALCGFLSRSS